MLLDPDPADWVNWMRKLDARLTVPQPPADRADVNGEVKAISTKQNPNPPERSATRHPVERVYAVLDRGGNTDDYIEAIRGR